MGQRPDVVRLPDMIEGKRVGFKYVQLRAYRCRSSRSIANSDMPFVSVMESAATRLIAPAMAM